jgi:hypothetical protein
MSLPIRSMVAGATLRRPSAGETSPSFEMHHCTLGKAEKRA